ncbi:unnamed protein product [Cyprideis torosa]|uniref:Uncharacterized protein n=1 Tax=Cyprideis torosa TaxID=163714 RepID=A0A7R8WNU0_9CRUS|nr:unnamed protein product [Cyprideis torosa]CAG0905050.1 unnamed protein product [Cyprideis torosa]
MMFRWSEEGLPCSSEEKVEILALLAALVLCCVQRMVSSKDGKMSLPMTWVQSSVRGALKSDASGTDDDADEYDVEYVYYEDYDDEETRATAKKPRTLGYPSRILGNKDTSGQILEILQSNCELYPDLCRTLGINRDYIRVPSDVLMKLLTGVRHHSSPPQHPH